MWLKFILLASNSAITAATRRPLGYLREDPDIVPLFDLAVGEAVAVAKAKGFVIADHALSLYAHCTKEKCPTRPASVRHNFAHE